MKRITAYLLSFAVLFPINAIADASGEFTVMSGKAAATLPQSIELSAYYLSIRVDETRLLTASVLPKSAENKNVVWSASDETVVKVDKNGNVKGIGEGIAVITAVTEAGRVKARCTVEVHKSKNESDFDFSEWNMLTNTSNYAEDGFDWDSSVVGGNSTIALAYLSRWDGAVLEENDEYPSYNGNSEELYKEIAADYHVQDAIWLPARNAADDNDKIKNAVIKYGAVVSSYFSNSYYYNNRYLNYYQPDDGSDSGYYHAIAIVGWDDDYSASNFKCTPPGNGAFICKNSWGDYIGDGGYFYISYYDKYIGKRNQSAVLTSLESTANYNTIYQYDPLGAVGSFYYDYSKTIYGANVFPQHGDALTSDEILKAVSFYTYSENTSYEVYTVTNYENKASLLTYGTAVASGTMEEMGYHTVTLDTPVSLSAGTRFAVIIKLKVSNGNARMYCEYPIKNYSSKARANEDESYLSDNGKNWVDFASHNVCENGNLCIKAFTDNGISSDSVRLFSAINNNERSYTNDKVYTLDEAIENNFGINKDYINYVRLRELESSGSAQMPQGIFPDIISTDKSSASSENETVFPSRYDLREENAVSSVKNQGSWGGCWAFSVYASLESAILKKSKTFDTAKTSVTEVYQSGISPTGLTLSDNSVTMAVGASYRLYADILPKDATKRDVSWSSDNSDIISVDQNGQLTALTQGTAVITCTTADGKYFAQCDVTAKTGTDADSISLAYNFAVKSIGDVFLIDYKLNPSTADCPITWSSDNPYVVSVNENGLMTALSAGNATVTADAGSGIIDTVNITVVYKSDFSVTSLDTDFKSAGNYYSGTVSAFIDNKSDDAVPISVILAAYDETGRMITAKQNNCTLYSGANTVTFDGLSFEKASSDDYCIKCFVWDNDFSSLKPAASAVATSF